MNTFINIFHVSISAGENAAFQALLYCFPSWVVGEGSKWV